jgi:hypothetical protein
MKKVGLRSHPFKAQRRERARQRPHSELMFVWKILLTGSRLHGRLSASEGGETFEDI